MTDDKRDNDRGPGPFPPEPTKYDNKVTKPEEDGTSESSWAAPVPSKPTCFIIMPVTTSTHVAVRTQDPDHFERVLNCLFMPAIKAAGMTPIPPKADGAAIIRPWIVKNLVEADLVLCDLTESNPNVFFELGIRTVVKKPVCLVRDESVSRIPFDINDVNVLPYASSLRVDVAERERRLVQEHLKRSLADGRAGNLLWRYFQMEIAYLPDDSGGKEPGEMEMILHRLERIEKAVTRAATKQRERDEPRGLAAAIDRIRCPLCGTVMLVSTHDTWKGDSDGDFPRYVDVLRCPSCHHEASL